MITVYYCTEYLRAVRYSVVRRTVLYIEQTTVEYLLVRTVHTVCTCIPRYIRVPTVPVYTPAEASILDLPPFLFVAYSFVGHSNNERRTKIYRGKEGRKAVTNHHDIVLPYCVVGCNGGLESLLRRTRADVSSQTPPARRRSSFCCSTIIV